MTMVLAEGWESVGWDDDMTEVIEMVRPPATPPMGVLISGPWQFEQLNEIDVIVATTPPYPRQRSLPRLRPTWRAVVGAPLVVEAVTLWLMR